MSGEWAISRRRRRKKDKAGRARGLGRKTKEEIEKRSQRRAQTPSTELRHPSCNHCSLTVFRWCSNSSKWLQTTQIKQGVSTKFTPAQIKPLSSGSRRNSFFLSFFFFSFLLGVDASHVYVGAWALGCFQSRSTRTFRKALTASLDSCAEIKSAPSVA